MSDDADLMGTAEVAAFLGLSRQRVLKLAEHEGFPDPLGRLSAGLVWDGEAVRKWAAQRVHDAPPADRPARR